MRSVDQYTLAELIAGLGIEKAKRVLMQAVMIERNKGSMEMYALQRKLEKVAESRGETIPSEVFEMLNSEGSRRYAQAYDEFETKVRQVQASDYKHVRVCLGLEKAVQS